jgi:Protein of unknown function (DUF3179)
MPRFLAADALVLLVAGCAGGGGGSELSETERERIEQLEEELSTLPDPGPGLGEAAPPPALTAGWKTDFARRTVPLSEFERGGPGKDGIPAIDKPRSVSVDDVGFLEPKEPVIEVVLNGEARAYPIQILVWHEIVNDSVGGMPLAVTFCPLCNTAIAFDRRVGGTTLDFGTTGHLRGSDLVMYDPQTESWWQQFGGRALVGALTGARLEQVPARVVAWREFERAHPDGMVLSRETGHSRRYRENPYTGYDDVDSPPFFATKNSDDKRLPPKERVVFIERGGEAVAVPFSRCSGRSGFGSRSGVAHWSSAGARGSRPRSTRGAWRTVATSAPPRCAKENGSSPSTSRSGSRSPHFVRTCGSPASSDERTVHDHRRSLERELTSPTCLLKLLE